MTGFMKRCGGDKDKGHISRALVVPGKENVLQPSQTINLPRVKELVIAGWTGRDVAALEKHIRELEAIGVKQPKTTPIFYRVAASLLTTDRTIEVLGDQSSGEVECVVYSLDDGLFVGVGWTTPTARRRPSASRYRSRCAPSR